MLTKSKIEHEMMWENIVINPSPVWIGPNSVDLTLGNKLLRYVSDTLDTRADNKVEEIIMDDNGFVLQKGVLYLGTTVETVWTDRYIPMIDGRSSIGRLGLFVHVSAGRGDVGFNGKWTLELVPTMSVKVYPGDKICQVWFAEPFGEIDHLYTGRYRGQKDVVKSLVNLGDDKAYI